jgi:hypothetical protein
MFARREKLCTGIPMDAPPQCQQEALLGERSDQSTKVHDVVVGSPVLARIQVCAVLLGLNIAFFCIASAFLAHDLTLTILYGADAGLGTVLLLSIILSILTCSTIGISTLVLLYTFDRLIYPLIDDLSDENRAIIIWHISYHFVLGALIGVFLAWVLIDLSLGIDRHIKYTAGITVGLLMLSLTLKTIITGDTECRFSRGMLLGVCSACVATEISLGSDGHIIYSVGMRLLCVMMLTLIFKTIVIWAIECDFYLGMLLGVNSGWALMEISLGRDQYIKYNVGILVVVVMLLLIFQFWPSHKHRQATHFGSLIETNKGVPTSISTNKPLTNIDPTETRCSEVAVLIV